MSRIETAVLTYNGIDGACAAAMVALSEPDAAIVATSAQRVAESLAALAAQRCRRVHVCGLGMYCGIEPVVHALGALRERGAEVVWHCGRGYLDKKRSQLEPHCTVHFVDAGTNTAAVARFIDAEGLPQAQTLIKLARFDPHIADAIPHDGSEAGVQRWLDLINAAVAQYLKFQDAETYVDVIGRLARMAWSERDTQLVETFRRTGYKYVIQGKTQAVRRLKERIQKCADAGRHVIVTGESGVGKEHVAHLLWERSARSMGPLVAVNCALYAGNAGLANSDLFGHKKGAFTGADRDRTGKFAEADTGILFLDELAELPPEVQAKLLRVIEDGRVMPEGADQYERIVDVLVIAATNRDLPAMIREGTFRADLYHRLATLRIHVPPLRERFDDVEAIVKQRLAMLAEEGYVRDLPPRDWDAIRNYTWPGNVRQLIKLVERAVFLDMALADALAEEQALGELSHDAAGGARQFLALPETPGMVKPLAEVTADYARAAWEACGENYSAAAKALRVSTNTLRYTYIDGKQAGAPKPARTRKPGAKRAAAPRRAEKGNTQ